MGTITLRTVDEELHSKLKDIADKEHRSIEGQAKFILHQFVYSYDKKGSRAKDVGKRLNFVLEFLQKTSDKNINYAWFAHAISQKFAGTAERWFMGVEEPSFTELDHIADRFGISRNWLLFGTGSPFIVDYHRLSERVDMALKELLSDPFSSNQLKELIFVRSDSENGEVAIVKQNENNKFAIWQTPMHLSDMIGNGGQIMLKHFFRLLQVLYKIYTTSNKARELRPPEKISSYIIPDRDFSKLIDGYSIPLEILKREHKSMWWEDVWDKKMTEQGGDDAYWKGSKALCLSIQSQIKQEPDDINE